MRVKDKVRVRVGVRVRVRIGVTVGVRGRAAVNSFEMDLRVAKIRPRWS